MGLSPINCSSHLGIATWPWGKYLGEKPIKVKISKIIRLHPKSCVMKAKASGYYANSILATLDAKTNGFDEAILLDYRGYIAEGPGENIFMVKDNVLYTPKKDSILPGITRDTIIKLVKDLKIKIKEKNITKKQIKQADEVFFVGTAAEITPIGQIDKKKINHGKIGPITRKLQDTFQKVVTGEIKRYRNWLSYIN